MLYTNYTPAFRLLTNLELTGQYRTFESIGVPFEYFLDDNRQPGMLIERSANLKRRFGFDQNRFAPASFGLRTLSHEVARYQAARSVQFIIPSAR